MNLCRAALRSNRQQLLCVLDYIVLEQYLVWSALQGGGIHFGQSIERPVAVNCL